MYIRTFFAALLLLATSLSQTISAQNQVIAFVDAEIIVAAMPEFKRVESELESFQKVLQKQLELEEAKMEEYYKSVMQQVQAGTMPPVQQKEAEAKLMKMQEDMQKKAADADKQLVKKEADLTKPLYDKFNNALKAVAVANGYTYIFDKKMMLYAEGGVDATDKLKKQLGIQ
jgi:outer membrane protein